MKTKCSVVAAGMLAVVGCSKKAEGPRPVAAPEQASIGPHVTNIIVIEKPRLFTEREIVEIEPDYQQMERRRIQSMTLVDDRKREKDTSNNASQPTK